MSNQGKGIVTLDFYKDAYKAGLSEYYLTDDQLKYTSLPLNAISRCEEDPTRVPIVILYNKEPAGFFVLHGWEGVKAYSDNKQAILLRGYSVNAAFQGKGIAKKSLRVLDAFVKTHFLDKKEIILAVNQNNTHAQHVYKRGGFADKGIRVMGRKGELMILHKDLTNEVSQ